MAKDTKVSEGSLLDLKAPPLDLDTVIGDPATRIVVCCGAGGVGKTTTAAALALRAEGEAPFCRDLFPFFRNECHLSRPPSARQSDHVLGRGDLEIDRSAGRFHQKIDITVLDMTSVFAQVDREPICSTQFGEDSRPHRIRFVRHPRLPNSRDVVDVHVQTHISSLFLWSRV